MTSEDGKSKSEAQVTPDREPTVSTRYGNMTTRSVDSHRAVGAEEVGVQQHRRVAVQLALHVQHVLRLQPAVVAEEPQVAPPAVTALR